MTELDKSILQFKRLVTLNLCGNFIKDIEALLIPQTLRSLELQTNHISDIQPFAEFLPPDLLYLGLSKNLITNGKHGSSYIIVYLFIQMNDSK